MPDVLTPQTLTLVVLLVVAAAVTLFHLVYRPAGPRRSALAALPWLVTGVTVHTLASGPGYPDALAAFLTAPWVYILVVAVGGAVWATASFLTQLEETAPIYVAIAGLGALLPPLVLLGVRGGLADLRVLALWVVIPLLAVLAAYTTLFALGVCLPEPTYYAGVVGVVVITGLVVDGVTTALVLEFAVEEPIMAVPAATEWLRSSLPVAHTMVFPSLVVWTRLALGVTLLIGLELLSRSLPRLAERGLGLATVGSVVMGANTFVLVVAGGWFE